MTDPRIDRYMDEHRERHLDELKAFLRIPSASSLPEHKADVRRAAEWLANHLRGLGVPTVEIMETDGHPVVYGHWPAPDGKPTALIYGHYDVQPPDPLDLWVTPPFEPTERDGRLYARGATDDKGNLFMPVKALEALVQLDGRPPIGLKFFFEGEEEIGSPNVHPFVRANRELLTCDVAVSADGQQWAPEMPSIRVASKGLAGCQVNLRAANIDLHSGQHGAAAPNAVERLVSLARTFHTKDGRVAVKGFYDDVRELTERERAEFERIPFDEAEYARGLGVDSLWGEAEYTALERRWARPTLDFNGIWGGFQGAGLKTVTPSEAHLKITCRLVPRQNPENILDLIEAHVREHTPPGSVATVQRTAGSSQPFEIPLEHPALRLAARVLREQYGKEPLVTRSGGTLPIAETFQAELGVGVVSFSWGMPGDQGHAPNESFRLDSFDRARRAHAAFMVALAELR